MLDSKFQKLKDHFGITTFTDWQSVKPAWILEQHNVGQATLDYLRMLLANKGLTLKDDQTPEYWKKNLEHARVSQTLGNEEMTDECDRGIICPFTILIDSAEQHPFTFQGFRGDADLKGRPLIVPTEWKPLGRHPVSLGDYSLTGGEGRCHVERKSMADAHSTILGFGDGHRARFECELENLSKIEAGLVVVECSLADLLTNAPSYGKRTASQNAKALHRSLIAFIQDYRTPWQFCDGRRLAEQTTFRWLERWHRKQLEERKSIEKEAAKKREAERAEELKAVREKAELELAGM